MIHCFSENGIKWSEGIACVLRGRFLSFSDDEIYMAEKSVIRRGDCQDMWETAANMRHTTVFITLWQHNIPTGIIGQEQQIKVSTQHWSGSTFVIHERVNSRSLCAHGGIGERS